MYIDTTLRHSYVTLNNVLVFFNICYITDEEGQHSSPGSFLHHYIGRFNGLVLIHTNNYSFSIIYICTNLFIRASVDALCRDDPSKISRDTRAQNASKLGEKA